MTEKTKKRIHLLYGILTGAVSVLAGLCLIAACCHIYYSGVAADAPQIYTRQIVAEHFAQIAVPVYTCLILVLGGIVLNMALPLEKPRLKPEKNLPLILQRLREKTDLEACDANLRDAIVKEQKRRKELTDLCAFGLAFAFILVLRYGRNADNWEANSTPSMVSAMYVMFGTLSIPFLLSVFAAYRNRKSMVKEIELMRQAAAQAPKAVEKAAPKARSNRFANIARIVILAAGILLVILGACNEGTKDILTKAVNICTECVGLG